MKKSSNEAKEQAPREVMRGKVKLIYRLHGKVKKHTLRGTSTVGSNKANSLCLAEQALSPFQFRIDFLDAASVMPEESSHGSKRNAPHILLLVDLKSADGTRVNGYHVDQAKLKPGDIVEAGSLLFVVYGQFLLALFAYTKQQRNT
jgi:hypothetical protein